MLGELLACSVPKVARPPSAIIVQTTQHVRIKPSERFINPGINVLKDTVLLLLVC